MPLLATRKRCSAKALDLYEREKLCYMSQALDAPTARDVAERLLRGALETQASDGEPRGYLRVISSVACRSRPKSIREEVITRRKSSMEALIACFEKGEGGGEPSTITWAPRILPVIWVRCSRGFSLPRRGRRRATKRLERLVETSLAVWPTK